MPVREFAAVMASVLTLLAIGGYSGARFGKHRENQRWERLITSEPAKVELIRERVNAQRAERQHHELR